MMCL
jgi:bloom syndrome protein